MDQKAENRRFVEEMSYRKACQDTQFFWSQVARNKHHQNAKYQANPAGKRLRSKEERELFDMTSELKKGVLEDNIPVERSGPLANEIGVLTSFADLSSLPPFVIRNIQLMRYELPTPIQKHAVPFGLFGLDLMCCAQTGSGKTMAFLLPVIDFLTRPSNSLEDKSVPISLESGRNPYSYPADEFEANGIYNVPPRMQIDDSIGVLPRAIILAPTRELASQIHIEARKLCFGSDLKAVCVYGGADIRNQLVELSTGCDLIVATPGRLTDLVDRGIVSLSQVEFLILDEADRMLDMGFEPQIRRIVQQCDMPDKMYRQTFLFSATFPVEVQTLAREFLRDYIWIGVGRVGSTVDNIKQNILLSSSDSNIKLQLLAEAIFLTEGRTLVFVQRKKTASWVCTYLNRHLNVAAEEIHGDRTQQQRENALRSFRDGRTLILIATDVAARGLDIPEVTHVIQFDLPISPDDFDTFIHRMGRTGRLGKEGLATSFFVPGRETGEGNGKIAPLILRLLKENQQVIPDWFLALEDNTRNQFQHGNSRFGGRDNRNTYQTNRFDNSNRGHSYQSHSMPHHHQQQQQQPQHQQQHQQQYRSMQSSQFNHQSNSMSNMPSSNSFSRQQFVPQGAFGDRNEPSSAYQQRQLVPSAQPGGGIYSTYTISDGAMSEPNSNGQHALMQNRNNYGASSRFVRSNQVETSSAAPTASASSNPSNVGSSHTDSNSAPVDGAASVEIRDAAGESSFGAAERLPENDNHSAGQGEAAVLDSFPDSHRMNSNRHYQQRSDTMQERKPMPMYQQQQGTYQHSAQGHGYQNNSQQQRFQQPPQQQYQLPQHQQQQAYKMQHQQHQQPPAQPYQEQRYAARGATMIQVIGATNAVPEQYDDSAYHPIIVQQPNFAYGQGQRDFNQIPLLMVPQQALPPQPPVAATNYASRNKVGNPNVADFKPSAATMARAQAAYAGQRGPGHMAIPGHNNFSYQYAAATPVPASQSYPPNFHQQMYAQNQAQYTNVLPTNEAMYYSQDQHQ